MVGSEVRWGHTWSTKKKNADFYFFLFFFLFLFYLSGTLHYIIRHYFKVLALFAIGLTSPCMLKGHPDYLLVVDVE